MVRKEEFLELKQKVHNQEEVIKSLQLQVASLDLKMIQLNAEKALSSHINTILSEKLDSCQQYMRRPCVVLEGLPILNGENNDSVETSVKDHLINNFGFDKDTVVKEFDKADRIGPIIKNNQRTIVKFRSHNFKSQVYAVRKNSKDKRIKVRPSLTKRRENLLYEANTSFEGMPIFEYAFADCNGNIKVKTRSKVENKLYFKIRNRKDLLDLIMLLDNVNDDSMIKFQSFDYMEQEEYDDAFCEIMLPNVAQVAMQ